MGQQKSLQQIHSQIQTLVKNTPKVLILGIGENRMGDDGLGQYISFYLDQNIKSSQIKVINGGIVPEERFSEIISFKPDLMIMIDSVDSGKKPGTVGFYEEDQMMNYLPISSHSLPLPILVDRCKRALPHMSIKLLGIQPYSLEFLESYELFQEDQYTLDDKEKNPNIPFYAFNLTPQMKTLCKSLIQVFIEIFSNMYFESS